jgi:hypothetical protein
MGVSRSCDAWRDLWSTNFFDSQTSRLSLDVGRRQVLLGAAATIGSRSKHVEFEVVWAPSRAALWLTYIGLPLTTV